VVGLGVLTSRRIARPLVAMSKAARAVSNGDLSATIAHESGDEVGDLASSLRALLQYLAGVGAGVDAIGRGDLDASLEKRSEADVLASSVLRARGSLKQLVEGVDGLIEAARSGNLGARTEMRGLEGAYQRLTVGMNDVMAAVDAPLREMREVVQRVADRDLTARMTTQYDGDYEAVKQAINLALVNVESALDGVSVASDQVATAAGEISTGSQSLSQAASEQASSLEEVTSSLQEITAMSRQNAANAQQARGMAQGAKDCAEQGVASMKELSDAVVAIKSHAAQTAKIVKTIDEIAFQTNLLALNAAVEAARAGDAGKGFAVVAEEVRNLAMRSADAAKTTARLIEESVKSSDLGVQLNGQAAAHFNEITNRVNKVVEVMEEIAAASDNQSRGVSQINGAVDEMARVTQHNAATTEQSAAAAEELSSQAAAVQNLVRDFRTTSSGDDSTPARAAPPVRSRNFAPSPRDPAPLPKSASRLRASARPAPMAAASNADFFPLDDEESLRTFEQF
jgi:methyl-accepting chemotaxis protein